ncbi:P-loop containing nucleoside triphosphate hydrolase protein [Tuber borchii]|uniref:RNA helicase n=1 Tax=Tuber borchii TaxID=42251 RepID=A0A2T7A377_TUBBO|nr:P-loop containing nucleoside triphosphate hydrolase protein [Tuber borchii]
MQYRASSPTGSEFEFDISNALADADFLGSDNENPTTAASKSPSHLSEINDILEVIDDSDGDQAFIAAQQAASNRKGGSTIKGKSVKKGGGFQSMGLNMTLLKAITKKGFSVPTPIQRKTIPLVLDGVDVVGMARTGSGKTAAFVIPMIERLKTHSVKVGMRALVLSPSRELALQTMKVVKEFGRGTDLKVVLLVGGDSLEEQFGYMAGNPDIVIATPGRFMHLKVEMELDLRSVQYVVFDEADRLFEMGFSAQLTEILHSLPSNRQTLLFSATLPKSLFEFAKAGLQEPSLIRLDVDSKISQDLESAFFTLKSSEKEGALLHLLQDVIQVPKGAPPKDKYTVTDATDEEDNEGEESKKGKKRKRTHQFHETASTHSTMIFAATKHHVEYLAQLITQAGFPVSYAYSTLDQIARGNQVNRFRTGETSILVVTDVAARGIDIPLLSNVINYDFPPQPKVFVHRVGRTARAGKRGWAYSFVRVEDAPYLLDLQLFLGKKFVLSKDGSVEGSDFASDIIVGSLLRDSVERCMEWTSALLSKDSELASLKSVSVKGEKHYQKTKPPASAESAKRAREIVAQKGWSATSPLFAGDVNNAEVERAKMLARVANFRPSETIFEIGQRGLNKSEAATVMKTRRAKIKIDPSKRRGGSSLPSDDEGTARPTTKDGDSGMQGIEAYMDSASDADLDSTFTKPADRRAKKKAKMNNFMDTEHYMSYAPSTSLAEDRGYSISSSFAEAARNATMDLTNDDSGKGFAEAHKAKGMRWDKKAKKYVQRANDEDGSKGTKMIIGESGQKIAASFKSGRFSAWKSAHKVGGLPRVGEMEDTSRCGGPGRGGRMGSRFGGRMFHKGVQAPKAADKARDDYHVRKKRFEEAKEKGLVKGAVRSEIKTKEQIRKEVKLRNRRREKNNRPSKKR